MTDFEKNLLALLFKLELSEFGTSAAVANGTYDASNDAAIDLLAEVLGGEIACDESSELSVIQTILEIGYRAGRNGAFAPVPNPLRSAAVQYAVDKMGDDRQFK